VGQSPDHQLFVAQSDGTGVTQLTSGPPGAGKPDWSPDGTRIAFSSFTDCGDIYVVNSDGSGRLRLTFGSACRDWSITPSWSPDGAKIAFTHSEGGAEDVFTMNSDGSGQTALTNNIQTSNRISDGEPVWSPDGKKLAFTSNRTGRFDIFTMNEDGSGVTNVTTTPNGDDVQPSWQAISEPKRGDYKSARQFCQAEREFLGEAAFRQKYGGRHAFGSCIRRNGGKEQERDGGVHGHQHGDTHEHGQQG
jgi:Tol biopolymer transport system component